VRRRHTAIRIVGADVFKPGRVEFMAIPLMVVILGVLFLVFAVSEVGVWAWILTGLAILAAIIVLAWRGVQRSRHPPAADAPRPAQHRAPGAHRILVVVDESCAPAAIRDAVAARAAGRSAEAFVVAPAAGSRLDRLMGDEAGYSRAQSHLDETLTELAAVRGLAAKGGKVGSHDPIQAADEALREFPADEILFALDPGASPEWLEDEALDLAESRYGIPVTKLVAAPTEPV
jgi:hypothetical protein